MLTIDFQGVNELLQQRDYLPNPFTLSVSHTCTLTNLMRNESYNKQLSFRVDIQMIAQ